ncbi:MAG: flagellar filament capping protein FliD [Acidobacteriaceae bacterium]|nr:flagellar filament capping protein FliD [Acidobacteriaceae bacterium]
MGTTSSTPTSASGLITPLTFTGQSTYSAQFQQVIDKAVQIQEIPLDGMADQASSDQSRQSALESLDQALSNLQTAVTGLQSAVGSQALAATVSDNSVASVSLNSAATTGVYQLEVDSLGSATQTVSTGSPQTVTDPTSQNISSASSFTLTVNGVPTTITPASDTLDGLVSALNGNSSLGVTASVVNVGSSGSPDYRLAVQSSTLGNVSIQLSDGANNLLNTISTGAEATYKVDGLPNTISSNSDTITLAQGVSVNLLSAPGPGNPITITVGQSTTSAQTALQQFASAYNAVVSQLAAQHGQNAGALSGDSILQVAQQALSSIVDYSNFSGSVTNLGNLGLDLDNSGNLTFNAAEFEQSAGSNFTGLAQFLGTSTSGFLGVATSALTSLEDPTVGAVKTEEASITHDLTTLNTNMGNEENSINQFQQNLVAQLSQSDAMIATLQSQVSFFQGLFQIENNISNPNNG